jgi:hypothetical protein
VLAGAVVINLTLDLALAAIDYHRWVSASETLREALGSLSNHLWSTLPMLWFPVVLAIASFALARRGRRWLFAGPALAFYFAPVVVTLLHGTPAFAYPGMQTSHFWPLVVEVGPWVAWVAGTGRLALVLIPGAIVAFHTKREPNVFRVPALVLMAVPAVVVGYLGVLFFSSQGRLDGLQAAEWSAAFLFGAGMGFDRPWWPWLVVAAPGLSEGILGIGFVGQSGELLAVLVITLLGAISVPFGRMLLDGWHENLTPGTLEQTGSSGP